MSTGIGGKMRSRLTTRRWLSGRDRAMAQRWHFPLPSLRGASPGGTSDAAALEIAARPMASSMSWAALAGGLGHGYAMYWLVRIDGWPYLHLEAIRDAIAPAGYLLDASLVVDRLPRLGSVVEGDSYIAKGFDAEIRFLDSPIVRALMRSPARFTTLEADLGAEDTTMAVASTKGFEDLSQVFIGGSCIPFGGVEDKAFTGLERHSYGRTRSYRKGAIVTDGPYSLQGRRVTMHVIMLDPSGRWVQGADILAKSAAKFSGYVAERPVKDGSEWVFTVRDQVRRIADPIGVSASGKAIFSPFNDALVAPPRDLIFNVELSLRTSGTIVSCRVQPFLDLPAQVRFSELRSAVVDALNAATTDPHVIGFYWRAREFMGWGAPIQGQVWELMCQFDPDTGDTYSDLTYGSLTPGPGSIFLQSTESGIQPCSDTVGRVDRGLAIFQVNAVLGATVSVVLDEGDPSTLPPEGHLVLEAAGVTDYAKYSSFAVDPNDPMRVDMTLDDSDRITGEQMLNVLSPEAPPGSARFLWADSGPIADLLRRALVSTGDAQHGYWDSLPRGQGLGLPYIDSDSFDLVFGPMRDLPMQIAVDSGTSVAQLFEGFLRFSRRALVTRERSDGAAVEIAAVDLGPVDSGVPVATITDDMLVTTRGRRPVRILSAYAVPQSIKVTCSTIPIGEVAAGEGVITFRDQHLTDWTQIQWDIKIHGLSREDLLTLGKAFALSWFRSGETRQIIEVDVPPTVIAQAGDVVALELPDVALWDFAGGAPGYNGLGRVMGSRIDPTTAVVTLAVALEGVLSSGAMSPSIPIVAVHKAPPFVPIPPAEVVSIDVAEQYFDLLQRAKGDAASWKLLAYLPGRDGGRAQYTVSTVELTAGVCRITVLSSPTAPYVELSSSYRLTWPTAPDCTTAQDIYLHNTDVVQWG